jgi:hypothetical protein
MWVSELNKFPVIEGNKRRLEILAFEKGRGRSSRQTLAASSRS